MAGFEQNLGRKIVEINNDISFISDSFSGFSIAEMRLLTDTQVLSNSRFYCKEIEDSYFTYDSSDSTSLDDSFLVIVTTSGKRLKREVGFSNIIFNSNQIE